MKKKISKFLLFASLFFLLSAVIPKTANAQCPMCRMSAEADLKNGGQKAKGLNVGILYMLSFPYILLGTFGFIWYRERRKIEEIDQLRELRNLLEPHEWKVE